MLVSFLFHSAIRASAHVMPVNNAYLLHDLPSGSPFDMDLHGMPGAAPTGNIRYGDQNMPILLDMPGMSPMQPTFAPDQMAYVAPETAYAPPMAAQPMYVADQAASAQMISASQAPTGEASTGTGKSSKETQSTKEKGKKGSSSKSGSGKNKSNVTKPNGAASISILSAIAGMTLCALLI